MDAATKLRDKLLKRTITQSELEAVESQRSYVAELKQQLKMAEAELSGKELDITTRLVNGARVAGRLAAVIETRAGKCSPQWKTEMVTHMEECHKIAPEVTEAIVQARWPGAPREVLVIAVKHGLKPVEH